ncbi:MAG: signal peptide peptidase SppA [Candidatus Eisenbacteria bacterium]
MMSFRRRAFVLVLLCVVLGAVALALVTRVRRSPKTPASRALLVYDVPSSIEESQPSFGTFSLASFRPERPTLFDITAGLRRAAEDDHVRGLVLHVGDVEWGWARVAEFREALGEFRASGKPIYASLDGGGEQSYLIAASADHLAMPPTAQLGLDGLSLTATFLKGTYDKLGIRPNFAHVGAFKSAVEQYTRESLSPDARRALDALLDDSFACLVDSIASARGLARDSVLALVDRGPHPAAAAFTAGLVDTLLHQADLDSLAARAVSKKPLHPQKLIRYLESPELGDPGSSSIALIAVEGTIMPGRDRDDPFGGRTLGSESLCDALRKAGKLDRVKAVVLRVDSPGGSGQASDDVWREVRRLRRSKPVVVSMSNLAASGGYYIACGADAIVAQPTTITGSIGVFGGKLNILGLYQKLGLQVETLTRGKQADMMSPYRDFSASEAVQFQQQMDAFYRTFLSRVSEGRGMPEAAVDSVAQGRVWSGRAALELGLVDSLGGLSAAVSMARVRAHIPEGETVKLEPFPERHGPFFRQAFRSLLDEDEDDTARTMLARLPEGVASWLRASSFPTGAVLALMPFTLELR